MRVSNFYEAKDEIPKQEDFTWESFAASLGPHDYSLKVKEQTPAFSPAEYPDGGPTNVRPDVFPDWAKRDNRNVLRLWLLVLDVDEVSRETYEGLVQFVQQLGLAAVVYSTWSHAAAVTSTGLYKFRVVIPLDKPVDGGAWKREFWPRASEMFGNVCDPRCKDPARLYFGPFAPAGTEALNFYYVLGGSPLSVDTVMARPLPEGLTPTEAEELRGRDAEAVALLAPAWPWKRRHEAHLALAGGLLSSGVSDERALEILCAVARTQDEGNEDRDKRQSIVEHTREQLEANEDILGWGTLAMILPYDVVEKVRGLVERPPSIDDLQLIRYAKQLMRSKHDYKAELGDALEKICKQRVIPEPLVLKLATELGERFFEYDAHSIAERFESSLKFMRGEGENVTVEQVETRIKQRQEEFKQQRRDRRKEEQERQRFVEHDKASRIRESFNNGRSHPYTAEELKQFESAIGTGHQWILQKDRAFYFFHYGQYRGPYSDAESHNAALRELSPASSAGVELYKITRDGAEFKSMRQLVAEYGTVADELLLDMRSQATTYDPKTRTIIEAPCPLRPITPRYHADVDEWLYWLAGPDYWNDLKTWLAILPRLDIVRVALFLTGKKSLGKSMLAQGCSRLWTTRGPTSLESAFGTFNDIVASCPLCFADEQLPKDFRGYTMNPQLRHHIQATERTYKRKHLPNGKLIGVTPTIVAAHDPSILRTPEELSNNEIEGIMERYFHIPVRDEAAAYLQNLRPTTFERGWVEGDVIAEFIMWLYHNHQHEKQGRFYIDRPDVENTRWLATSSGARSAVLRWLCAFLADRRLFEGNANTLMHVRVHKGELLVNITGLLKFWDLYVGNEKCPPSGKLATTIGELSESKRRVQLMNGKDVPTNYRVINTENLLAWAKNSDFIAPEEILKQLSVDSVKTSVGLVRIH